MMQERYFVVSDLHGDGIMYDYIISFLEKLYELTGDKISLYINGDIIDRGPNSISMLMDVMNRCYGKVGNIDVTLLAGNHEYMMYESILDKEKYYDWNYFSSWFYGNNGGRVTASDFDMLSDLEQEKIKLFISHLPVYHKFLRKIDNQNILLVHAMAPSDVEENCHLFLDSGCDIDIYRSVWTRKKNFLSSSLGKDGYFTIIGHTPVNNLYGYYYDESDNILNIDGGCAMWVSGYTKIFDHTPLVELDFQHQLINLLIFNHNHQIIEGRTITCGYDISMNRDEFSYYQSLVVDDKVKKRVR